MSEETQHNLEPKLEKNLASQKEIEIGIYFIGVLALSLGLVLFPILAESNAVPQFIGSICSFTGPFPSR